ncbi:MAG: efflux RND transporter periplasmic adaptor subunit [Thermodesulfobacteriota bacterium]
MEVRSILMRIVIVILILGMAVAGLVALKKMKKPPPQVKRGERPIRVETITAAPTTAPVTIRANGELRSVRTVEIAAQVAGTVLEVHPRLFKGEIIEAGELLFRIDEREYQTDYKSSRSRLALLQRDLALAEKELARVENLLQKNKVGSIAGVEKAQRSVNSIGERLAQVEQSMARAELNLERCLVRAPFRARITMKNIEQGTYVSPGKITLGLADDSVLELEVAMDSRDVLNWLEFEVDPASGKRNGWFGRPKPVSCRVTWTENPTNEGVGTLDRIVDFDPRGRTVRAVILVDTTRDSKNESQLPLVAGMYCSVAIPGRDLQDVVILPRSAVSFDNNVYLVRENRLITTPVTVARQEADSAYISHGIAAGDEVIVTRLISPLEQSLVQVADRPEEGSQ